MPAKTTRRALLGAGAALPLAAHAADAAATRAGGATFVFVPGTWHGGWAWTPLAEALRARGHRAFTVTCTGVGERSHLLTRDVGLATHVTDVCQLIEFEELNDVILCGHSFGGVTITGVADRMRDRISRLVYYDAFIPTPERPAWVMRDANGQWPEWWRKRREKFVDGYKMDFFAEYPIEMLVDPAEHPDVAALLQRRLTLHPARQWTEPASFDHGGWQGLPRTYLHCVGQTFRRSSEAMYGPALGKGWRFVVAPTPRVGMLTHTALTARLFDDVAAGG
ncbi:MAG: alpha/beta fold hydrolase [Pseudomonadota bacterium]